MKTKQNSIPRSAAKWLPGAMALAATTAGSQAATVQITLFGNKISSTGGNQLNADLTGDLQSDITISQTSFRAYSLRVRVNGGRVIVAARPDSGIFSMAAAFADGYLGRSYVSGTVPMSMVNLNPITFSDSRINGGAETEGWLEVYAFNTSTIDHTAQLTRLIFDDSSTTRPMFSSIPDVQTEWGSISAVPEPSGFVTTALLLGAAGLIRRRQAKAA